MIDNLHGTLLSASNLTFSESLLNNNESSKSVDYISIRGNTVNLTYGYPSANSRSLNGIMSLDDNYTLSRLDTNTILIKFKNKSDCGLSYKAAQGASDKPTLIKIKDGC